MVSRFDVKTEADVIAYMIDCTLATVDTLASKKSRGKHEYQRQKKMAAQAITWARRLGIDLSTTRAKYVIDEYNGDVDAWAMQYEVKQ